MKKKLFVAGLIMIMALSMFSCGSSDSGESSGESSGGNVDTFIVRSVGDPASFNPDGAADDNLFPIAQNMYRRLVGLDTTKGNVVGEAAKEWSYNEDATELTFTLRDDLVWSDGEPLTSEDVKYTFEAIAENEEIANDVTGALEENITITSVSVDTFGYNYEVEKN